MGIRPDYKLPAAARSSARWRTAALAAVPLVVTIGVVAISFVGLQASASRGGNVELSLELPEPLDETPSLTAQPGSPIESDDDPSTSLVTVRSGDSLARIFARIGLAPADVHAVVNASRDARRLASLRPGQQLAFTRGSDGGLLRLDYRVDDAQTLSVFRGEGGYETALVDHPLERRVAFAEGVIDTNLFNAGRAAGLSDALTIALANDIFGWDIDFVLDIREGDRFMVLYEQLYRDGEKVRDGDILAAEFVNRGRALQAVRFVDDDGRADFYAPDGKRMRKAFRRVPMDVFRLSSHFNPNRRHPVLNTIRAHRGVDYAAPTGTPIFAAGDGRVIRRSPHGGYGNTVEIQHPGGITTLYAHMSRFHPRVTVGTRVRQGDVIGYVGKTGLATGPHLHYEFRLNGSHVNPVTVRLPNADPLPSRYAERFANTAVPLLAHMQALSNHGTQFAWAPTSSD